MDKCSQKTIWSVALAAVAVIFVGAMLNYYLQRRMVWYERTIGAKAYIECLTQYAALKDKYKDQVDSWPSGSEVCKK